MPVIDDARTKDLSVTCGSHRDRRRQKISGSPSRHEKQAECRCLPGIRNSFVEAGEYPDLNENAASQSRRAPNEWLAPPRAVVISRVSERLAEKTLRDQSARSASRLPLYFLILPVFRSRLICRSARFTKRFSSCSVTPYSRRA
jgi:hypothetical protein